MKLAINLPLMVAWQAYGEALCHRARGGLGAKASARSVRRSPMAPNPAHEESR